MPRSVVGFLDATRGVGAVGTFLKRGVFTFIGPTWRPHIFVGAVNPVVNLGIAQGLPE